MGIGLLRSDACYGPTPLPPVYGRGVGGFFCWGQGIGIVGWAAGVASRDWTCARRDRSGGGAFALTRDWDWVAAIRCSLRPSPAAAGVWSGCGWFFAGDRGLGLLGGLLGVASRDWACARRDRSGGDGFRADARWGLGCCDPMLATAQPRCRRCVVGVWVVFDWGRVDREWGFGIGGGGG